MTTSRTFTPAPPERSRLTWADAAIILILVGLLAFGAWLAQTAPAAVRGPEISLAPAALPYYVLLSVGRMAAAYTLSLLFTLIYGYLAAYNPRAERVLIPLLDILYQLPMNIPHESPPGGRGIRPGIARQGRCRRQDGHRSHLPGSQDERSIGLPVCCGGLPRHARSG